MTTRTESLHAVTASWGVARAGWVLLALCAIAGLCAFAWMHPLGVTVGTSIAVGLLALMAVRRDAWLMALPALVPVIDLAAWTGAIHFTESDALVLSALAVGGLREALQPGARLHGGPWRFGLLPIALAGLMLSSYLVSTEWRSVLQLAAEPGLVAGYSSWANGGRLAKGFFWALLLLPLLASAMRARAPQAISSLVTGLLLGLVLVSLGAVWERMAFTGLSNFASDYRTTSLFWEMNVGGATLDGWLALTVPFALWAVLREGGGARLPLLMAILALAGYVCFTTFSRGLYLGVALGGGLTAALMLRDAARRGTLTASPGTMAGWGAYVVVLGALLTGVFQTGGYRGLGAMLGLALAVYAIGSLVTMESRRTLGQACLIALPAAMLSLAAMWMVSKGVYLAYALSGALLVALLRIEPAGRWADLAGAAAIACLVWLAVNAVLVSAWWAEEGGMFPALVAGVFVLLPLAIVRARPAACWRPDVRGWVIVALVLGSLAAVVVTFNTYYASQRFETVAEDLAGRGEHWSLSASLPQGEAEWWFGVGTGQFAERYFWRVPDGMYPGTHGVRREDGNAYLQLGGARHVLGAGELYRVSQRVSPRLQPPLLLALRARAPEGDARLHLEVCRKHLLYGSECTIREMRVPGGGTWVRLDAVLEQGRLGGGGSWLPRITAFSVANGSRGRLLEVDDISLIDAQGRNLLDNGEFAAGSDFWFFTSDRHHLPWHAKNLWLHYFVEQGAWGLAAFTLLGLAAFYRVTVGRAATHALAPPLAGALAGFFVVGAFDSLLDAPRLSVLAFLLMFVALGLRQVRPRETAPGRRELG